MEDRQAVIGSERGTRRGHLGAVVGAGAKSEETPFTIVPAVKPLPPIIGNWQSPKITGAGVPGYIVTLYVNDTLAGTTTVDEYRDWEFELPGTPPNTTKLKATTNENVANAPVSDPFYITVGQPRATLKIDATSVTTSGFSGTTTDLPQIVQGWRLSDGLKVADVPVASNPIVGTYLSGSNIKSGDVIKFISQNDMGDPEDSFSIFHGNVVN